MTSQSPYSQNMAPPPTAPAAPTDQSKWPTVIGVIAIVLGAGAGLMGCAGLAMLPFYGQIMEGMGTIDPRLIEAQRESMPITVPLGILTALAAFLLLFAGIATLCRRVSCRRLSLIWAPIKIVLTLANSVASYSPMVTSFELGGGARGATGIPTDAAQVIVAIIVVITVLWGWALPVFMLIWFSRGHIREEVDSWREQAEPPYGTFPPQPQP